MFGSTMLEVIIGLVFVFSLISLLASAIQEFVARILAMRSTNLKDGIEHLLAGDTTLTKELYKHPLIAALGSKNFKDSDYKDREGPAYIPSHTFALALLDQLKFDAGEVNADSISDPSTHADAISAIKSLANSKGYRKALIALIDAPGQALTKDLEQLVAKLPTGTEKQQLVDYLKSTSATTDQVVKSIEAWYDDVMEQVSGWYKRKAQLILFFIGLVIAIGGNIDTIAIYSALSRDATLRAAIVQSADAFVRSTPPPTTAISATVPITSTETQIVELQQQFQALALPNGWVFWPPKNEQIECVDLFSRMDCVSYLRPAPWSDALEKGSIVGNLLTKLAGWLATALAVTVGAPFWFDLLSKLVNLRSGFKPKEEASSKQE